MTEHGDCSTKLTPVTKIRPEGVGHATKTLRDISTDQLTLTHHTIVPACRRTTRNSSTVTCDQVGNDLRANRAD